jgi:hypothetical protein
MSSSSSSNSENFINDIDSFLASSQAAPIAYSEWVNMPRKMKKTIQQQMNNDKNLFKIFIYNKSRSIDRICPHCHKHYSAVNTVNNIENDRAGSYTKGQLEQALSGICSLECYQALNGSDVLNDWFGKIADKVYVFN